MNPISNIFCCFPVKHPEQEIKYGSTERSERRTDREINDQFFKIIKTSRMENANVKRIYIYKGDKRK